jgi:hypothetical protein
VQVEELLRIRKILERGWSNRTTYLLGEYDGSGKSLGQCYVTARALHHVFGWDILFDGQDGNNHFWNRLPCGLEVDFTSDQMNGDGIYPVEWLEGKPRRFKPLQKCKTVNPRLKLFLSMVESALRDLQESLIGSCNKS